MRFMDRTGPGLASPIVRGVARAALAAALAGALATRVAAQDPSPQAAPEPPATAKPDVRHLEVWTGADGFRRVWSSYAGATWAPLTGILEDGMRVRIVGGYGGYQFGGKYSNIQGRVGFVDALTGYHLRVGELTVKAFGGIAFANNTFSPYQPAEAGLARTLGQKGLVELWYNLPSGGFASLDLGYSTVMSRASGKGRVGFALGRGATIGVEVGGSASTRPQAIHDATGAVGAIQPQTARLGAFTRMGLWRGELDLSAGWSVSRDARAPNSSIGEPYAGVQWLTRF